MIEMDYATQQQLGQDLARAFLIGNVFAVLAGLYTARIVDLFRDALYSWRSTRRLRARRRRQLLQQGREL